MSNSSLFTEEKRLEYKQEYKQEVSYSTEFGYKSQWVSNPHRCSTTICLTNKHFFLLSLVLILLLILILSFVSPSVGASGTEE